MHACSTSLGVPNAIRHFSRRTQREMKNWKKSWRYKCLGAFPTPHIFTMPTNGAFCNMGGRFQRPTPTHFHQLTSKSTLVTSMGRFQRPNISPSFMHSNPMHNHPLKLR
ncbi:hypothetical protein PIB30_107611, partial [Stylosanthes scabra]|nr:hypothetical protein [Stylosanthes scabra]